jgi:type II secretory pathway pseudopilin PulG
MKLAVRPRLSSSLDSSFFGSGASVSFMGRSSQRGVVLLLLLIALALTIIALGIAAPKLAQAIKRDREIEMIHRGTQYARAIKRYYKKFGRYPATIEQLENTNNLRFLRKRYTDPMSKDGKWRPVRFGEVQLGQQGGGAGAIGGTGGGALPPLVGGTLNRAGSSFLQGTGTQPGNAPNPSSTFGPSSSFGPNSSFGSMNSQAASPNAQQPSALGQPSGQTFGGGAILGVASTNEAQGFHEYNEKKKYNQWLFVYDPNQDRGALITGPYNPKAFMGQAPQVGAPAGQMNQQPGSVFTNSPGNLVNNPGGLSNNPAPTQPAGGQPSNPQ